MRPVLLVALLLVGQAASAQVMYKCAAANGKIEYSDRPCATGVEVKRLAPDGGPSPEDVARARMRVQADREKFGPGGASGTETAGVGAERPPNQMSEYDAARRVRELNTLLGSTTIDKEKRRAAQDELDRYQRGVAQRMTAQDQADLARLRVGLGSIDPATRKSAEQQQRAILDRYENPQALAQRQQVDAEEARRRAAINAAAHAQAAKVNASTLAAGAPPQVSGPMPILPNGQPLTPAAGGAIDPRTGTFYSSAAGGYVNSQTGKFVPAP